MNKVKSLENDALSRYLSRQLNHFFPDDYIVDAAVLCEYMDAAENRIYNCFAGIPKKYFNEGDRIVFNHLQSDQYCMYLYMLANSIHRNSGDINYATKLYYLNKALHSVDIYFTSQLPEVFLLVHPLGTIIGRAKFGDNFVAYQGCTIGCLNDGVFPTLGSNIIMYANSSILGTCTIGSNVCVAAGVRVINTDIPNNSIVMGEYPNYKILKNEKVIFNRPPFFYGK